MAIDPIASSAIVPPLASGTAAAGALSLADNFDTFLTLLTTQLKNQDPLSPMDSSEFTQQLVQFSSVEQQIHANKNLESLIALQRAGAGAAAVGYIGREVTAESDTAALKNGHAVWSYALDADADETTILVKDMNGKIVATRNGETGIGRHIFDWDGLDNLGNPLPDGAYSLEVSATGANGGAVTVAVGITGVVSGVLFTGDEPELAVGGVTVRLRDVLSVSNSTGSS
jgi:flagellar basal-body rod modification protein FlgD